MRISADVHISPRTMVFLRFQGHDAFRVSDALTPRATDNEIITQAGRNQRTMWTGRGGKWCGDGGWKGAPLDPGSERWKS